MGNGTAQRAYLHCFLRHGGGTMSTLSSSRSRGPKISSERLGLKYSARRCADSLLQPRQPQGRPLSSCSPSGTQPTLNNNAATWTLMSDKTPNLSPNVPLFARDSTNPISNHRQPPNQITAFNDLCRSTRNNSTSKSLPARLFKAEAQLCRSVCIFSVYLPGSVGPCPGEAIFFASRIHLEFIPIIATGSGDFTPS